MRPGNGKCGWIQGVFVGGMVGGCGVKKVSNGGLINVSVFFYLFFGRDICAVEVK